MESDKIRMDVILTQWQVSVEMADSVSRRRDVMNNLFVTLNLAVLAAVSAMLFEIKGIFIVLAGIALSVTWILFIRNFKLLNQEKYKIIIEMEDALPVQPFNEEWESLKVSKKYLEETKLEKILPITFIVLYIIVAVLLIILKWG